MGTLQIKDVPDAIHEELRRRATQQGMTLRDYILDLVARDLSLPTRHDWLASLEKLPGVRLKRPAAEIIRDVRADRYGKDDDDRR